MGERNRYISVSDFCKEQKIPYSQFYDFLGRHPELSKKLHINADGERVLDEKSLMSIRAAIRKEKAMSKVSVSGYADELNLLAAKNEELREEVIRLREQLSKVNSRKKRR